MPSPRLNRLANDYSQLRMRFDGHPFIWIEPVGTHPPEAYNIVFDLPTLVLDSSNRPRVSNRTFVSLTLPQGYPKEKPKAVSNEQIFHPNFSDYICIADFWSPAQSLSDIVLDIGQMLQWQKYNIQSPLNAIAAEWAVSHAHELPIGSFDIYTASATPSISIQSHGPEEGHPQ